MAIIKGYLVDGTSKPITDCTIVLHAKKNSNSVLIKTEACEVSSDGYYEMTVLPCNYDVVLLINGYPPKNVGTIQVFSDSEDGTLNDFLLNPVESELTPSVVAQIIDERKKAQLAATESKQSEINASASAESTKASEEATQELAANASDSAASAGQSALTATNAANSASQAEVNTTKSELNTKTSETNAKTSEVSASELATKASDSAKTATDAATSIVQSAIDAERFAHAAEQSATNAASSENIVSQNATSAQQAADNASESAISANASASTAMNAENNATASAISAGESASIATNAVAGIDAAITAAEQVAINAENSADVAQEAAEKAVLASDGKVDKTQKINEYALNDNITLNADDVEALPAKKVIVDGEPTYRVDTKTNVLTKENAKWYSKAIGEIVAFDDVDIPPTNLADCRYIRLNVNSIYNTDNIVINQTVTGTEPLVTATGVINLVDSPLHGRTIHFINTEGRTIRAYTIADVVRNDAIQNITGQFGGVFEAYIITATGPFLRNVVDTRSSPGNGTNAQYTQYSFDASRSTRTDSSTHPRDISKIFYMRVL